MATTSGEYDYFYWYIENLKKRVQLETIYQTKNLRTNEGESLIDNYVMTDNDIPIFMRMLRLSSGEVFKLLTPYTRDFTDAYKYNTSLYDIDDTLIDSEGIMYITDLHDEFVYDLVDQLDATLEEAIVSGVLYQWWNKVGLKQMSVDEKRNFENQKSEVNGIISRRTKEVTRPHKSF